MLSGPVLLTAVLMGLATAPARFLPFLVGHRLTRPTLRRLFTDLFPPAVLAVLIVFFFWNVGTAPRPVQAAQAAGALVTIAAHLGLRNLLVSVGTGTAVCILVQNLWPG
ncbi:MAG TPA: AzlD domain-containing protein [Azospirillaceae bacterium]|nr:AzlD domain-containing protein [Azospirillaceae bacterium]